jgi:hypothetical protein
VLTRAQLGGTAESAYFGAGGPERLTGTVTSWSEMLLTAMLIVYNTEKAPRMRFSLDVKRAGTCTSQRCTTRQDRSTHESTAFQRKICASTPTERVKPRQRLPVSSIRCARST